MMKKEGLRLFLFLFYKTNEKTKQGCEIVIHINAYKSRYRSSLEGSGFDSGNGEFLVKFHKGTEKQLYVF